MSNIARYVGSGVLAFAAVASAAAQDSTATSKGSPQGASTREGASALEEIIVTARRREESLQRVPVSVTAVDAEAIERAVVRDTSDLTRLTPGFRFAAEGGVHNVNLSIRGLSKIPTGQPTPAVDLYFAEVPLRPEGAIVPTFDLASIQVFKGPQGTLFGRNSIGGAVLISPQLPTYDFNGYTQVQFGNYDHRAVEAAVTLPLVDQKLAVRLAGQLQQRDGYTENLSGGPDFDDMDNYSLRASVLFEPTDWLKNLAVFDYFRGDEVGMSAVVIGRNPGVLPAALAPLGSAGAALAAGLNAQIASTLAAQQAMGPRKVFSSIANPHLDRKIHGLANITEIDFGGARLRNLFGYRDTFVQNTSNPDGLAPLPGNVQLLKGATLVDIESFSEELQLLGSLWGDRGDWIVGASFAEDRPGGPSGDQTITFNFNNAPRVATTTLQSNYTRGLFGQIAWNLSGLLQGLKLNLGYRYTWSDVRMCVAVNRTAANLSDYFDEDECESRAGLSPVDGQGILRTESSAPTWTIGLDYQVTDDLFLYVASRRGYRQGGITAPVFESPNTTGDPDGAGPIRGIDLRAFQYYEPETVTDYEIGTKWDFEVGGWRQRINVAAFTTDYENAVQSYSVSGFVTQDGGFPIRGALGVNGADFTIKGVELDAVVAPSQALAFSLSGAYIDQEAENVRTIAQFPIPPITLPTPELSYTIAADWTLPIEMANSELALHIDYFWTDDYQTQGIDVSGYELTNARLAWKNIAGRPLDAAIFGRNLADEDYILVPIVLRPNFPLSAAGFGEPRTYGLEVRYRFGE